MRGGTQRNQTSSVRPRRVGHPSRGIESGCRTLWFLEGSGFRANFERNRTEHAPQSMGLLFDSWFFSSACPVRCS